jgi:twitching motility two-component system response regulator PilH
MAEIVLPNAGPQVGNGDRVRRLVVIIDGNAAHLYYTSMLLQRLEYNIHTAKAAEDVIELIDTAHPALVLTEIALAGMDGVEALKTIKRNPQTHAIPVMVLTSSKDPAVKAACLQEGCTNFFQKPVDHDALYAAIQKATESRPRQYIRLHTHLNVIVGDDKASEHFAVNDYVTALSEQGMFISTSRPKPVGVQVPITLLLENEKIKIEGMVLYSFTRDEGPLKTPGMGIKFVRIKDEDQALIKSFIRKEITKGLTMGQLGGTIL